MKKTICISIILLFALSVTTPSFAAGTGIGVIGDSNSEPYRCIGRGIASSYNWAEILASKRGVNFGAGVCQDYNKAVSGGSIANDIIPQAQAVAADYAAGKIQKVIFFIGYNDYYAYGKTSNDVPGLLNKTQTAITILLSAGVPSQSILFIDIGINNNPNVPQSIRDTVALYNTGLGNLVAQYNTRFVSQSTLLSNESWRQVPGGLDVGGQTFTNTAGNEAHNLFLADGHNGTIMSGLMANNFFASFLGIAPLTDNELLSQAGLLATATNTPVPVSTITPSPTVTRTPTLTPQPTFTRTPTKTPTSIAYTYFTCTTGNVVVKYLSLKQVQLSCK